MIQKLTVIFLTSLNCLCLVTTQSLASDFPLLVQASPSTKIKSKSGKKANGAQPKSDKPSMASESMADESVASSSSTRSEDIRKDHRYEVNALYTPASDFVLEYGASFAKSFSPRLRLGLTYLVGSKDVNLVREILRPRLS